MESRISMDILKELTGTYSSFHELEEGVLEAFNRRVGLIPPNYSYRQLIDLALKRGWVVRTGSEFRVAVS
jgi:hypothetical protein